MYKKIFLLSFAFLAGMSGQGLSAQSIFDQWMELKNFHGVMSQTFHPSEEGDLAPIKNRSGEMAEKAKVLAKSAIPATFQTTAIKAAVKQLKKDSKSLHKLIQGGKSTDEQITTALNDLHDVFHQIVGLCKDETH
ncbi:MAG TPA: hypothetical protein PKA00_01295 [Saprospiraceae bacterium]|nr:hypothetical protein [Saprospiraceae bacterium]HMQ81503.1 hypothetical protein [Saprospiraceae bacterium]